MKEKLKKIHEDKVAEKKKQEDEEEQRLREEEEERNRKYKYFKEQPKPIYKVK